ncbi:hypothetical protein NC651_032185 [Populus alba x Populus x berolinensis]|nr:hypothetical protein NC651_032185 [Populus alba x Populus x berolinensis]
MPLQCSNEGEVCILSWAVTPILAHGFPSCRLFNFCKSSCGIRCVSIEMDDCNMMGAVVDRKYSFFLAGRSKRQAESGLLIRRAEFMISRR